MALPLLTAEATAPFATVLRASDGKFTEFPMVLEPGDVPGHHAFAILCPRPQDTGTVSIGALERHPHSTQSFIPITAGRWLVLLAPALADGTPDVANMRVFVAGPKDAICISRNVWHAGLTVFDRPAEFGMMMWKADAGDDGVLHELQQPISISID